VQASAIAEQDTSPDAAYSRFRAAVAHAQFEQWLGELAQPQRADGAPSPLAVAGLVPPPGTRPGGRVIDASGPDAGTRNAELAAKAGHRVLRVIPAGDIPPGDAAGSAAGTAAAANAGRARLPLAVADGGLDFLASNCADAVIAEDRTLSRKLAAEEFVGEIARVLKPGGRVLASVDSLTLGMSVLAQQHHWPHLVDLPHADVILVPWPDGSITRCYGAEHLRELFIGSGFEVSWLRPRTVFAPTTVGYLLGRDPGSFKQLVKAELRARADDSVGDQLIVSAVLAR
jgi:SAM-dependent methyltransferase